MNEPVAFIVEDDAKLADIFSSAVRAAGFVTVLAENGRITAFLDPALYFAVDEMELAYIALFNSFGTPFFRRYEEIRPLPPGFYEERRHLYSLYPLLSHVCHFGGSYVGMVDSVLRRFGF